MGIAYSPATDLLGRTAPITDTLEVPLLGVPLIYGSNSPAVIAMAARALAPWRELPPGLVEAGPPARVTVIVHPLGPGDPAPPAQRLLVRAHGDSFLAAGGGSILNAQIRTGTATAFVTPDLAADEPTLRHNVIESLGLLLVSYRDRTPISAAAVARNGRAVLLAGQRTAGTSTLCYACVRAGFGLIAEDTVRVSQARGMHLWGHPGSLHLQPDASSLFPELAALTPQVQADGTLKLVVDVPAAGPEGLVSRAERAIVCLVERVAGQASSLEPIAAGAAAAALSEPHEPGFDLLRENALTVARALAAAGAYRLRVGSDPTAAAALLAHLTA